jgi:hypothetical protein
MYFQSLAAYFSQRQKEVLLDQQAMQTATMARNGLCLHVPSQACYAREKFGFQLEGEGGGGNKECHSLRIPRILQTSALEKTA